MSFGSGASDKLLSEELLLDDVPRRRLKRVASSVAFADDIMGGNPMIVGEAVEGKPSEVCELLAEGSVV